MLNAADSFQILNAKAENPDVFIIAEIGINHNGNVDIAKKLIDHAVSAGCDAVKFQKRSIEIVYTREVLDQPRESPWGSTQRAQKYGLEFGEDQYDEIDRYCKKNGIIWFASAWDIPSQIFLRKYNSRYNKIASALMTHKGLLEEVASEQKLTFLSTGMCTLENIDAAVEIFDRAKCQYVLLHSVSTYPANEADLNLAVIDTLKNRYMCPIGYSGHESSVSPSIFAAVLGARVIERHITLDRSMYGSDQSASLELPGLLNLVTAIRKIGMCLGEGKKIVIPSEIEVAKKLRYWE
jgi:N-acetylneuraminate synthase